MVLVFAVGAILGSFLNVCIYRIPRQQSIVWPPSYCPSCGRRIRLYDNIPIVSYILLRGRCRFCSQPISPSYPLVEALTGLLLVVLFLKFGLSFSLLFYTVLILLLLVVSLIDIRHQLILNKLTFPGFAIGLVFALSGQFLPFKGALIGSVVGAGVLLGVRFLGEILFKKESLGMGDVKLAGLVGLFLGWSGVLLALFLAFLTAGLCSAFALALGKVKPETPIPFGPFISFGALLFVLFGETVLRWYMG